MMTLLCIEDILCDDDSRCTYHIILFKEWVRGYVLFRYFEESYIVNMQLSIACHIMQANHILCVLKLPQYSLRGKLYILVR